MINIYQLVPKNKFDNSNIERLKVLTSEEIKPILPKLLEWLQDYNWPIAKEVLPILSLHQSELIPVIINVLTLEEKDDIWKYWIITYLIPLFSDENIKLVFPYLKRIIEKPTKGEREEMVDKAVIAFLERKASLEYKN